MTDKPIALVVEDEPLQLIMTSDTVEDAGAQLTGIAWHGDKKTAGSLRYVFYPG
jgi:hypothetical protein